MGSRARAPRAAVWGSLNVSIAVSPSIVLNKPRASGPTTGSR